MRRTRFIAQRIHLKAVGTDHMQRIWQPRLSVIKMNGCVEVLDLTIAELESQGVDAVLWLEAMPPDLEVYGKIDPDAAIVPAVRGTLEDTARENVATHITWVYRSKRRDYFKLANDEASLLHDLINRFFDEISQLIVADLFYAPSAPTPIY